MENTCSISGCVSFVRAHGLCAAHYERQRRYGDPLHLPSRNRHRSEETKAKISATMKANGAWFKQRGVQHPCTGRIASDETREKLSLSLRGNKNCEGKQNTLGKTWKLSDESRQNQKDRWARQRQDLPEKCSYMAAHIWMRRYHTKTGVCEACGTVRKSSRHTHWANISGTNKRSRDDYWELCASCHKLFDYMLIIDKTDPVLISKLRLKRRN